MKLMKSALICCALLLAGTLSACEISDQPQQFVTQDSNKPDVTEIIQNNSSDSQAAAQNSSAEKPASDGGVGNAAPAQDSQAAPAKQDTPAELESSAAPETPKQNDTPAASNSDDAYKVGSEPSLSIGVVHAKAGQKSVPVTVKVSNNPGFAAGGVRVVYDSALKPKYNPETYEGVSDTGAAAGSALTYCSVAPENNIVAFGILGQKNSDTDGNLFTCYFDIPENATSGKVYKLYTEVESLNDIDSQPVTMKLIGGEIRID